MITLPYPSPLAARQSRINAGWDQIPGGRYSHPTSIGAVARIDGCDVVIELAPSALHIELQELFEESAAIREEGEFDRSRQGGK